MITRNIEYPAIYLEFIAVVESIVVVVVIVGTHKYKKTVNRSHPLYKRFARMAAYMMMLVINHERIHLKNVVYELIKSIHSFYSREYKTKRICFRANTKHSHIHNHNNNWTHKE